MSIFRFRANNPPVGIGVGDYGRWRRQFQAPAGDLAVDSGERNDNERPVSDAPLPPPQDEVRTTDHLHLTVVSAGQVALAPLDLF